MNTQEIIIGAKAILTGLFEYNNQTDELDDSFFIPMIKACIQKLIEHVEEIGASGEEKKEIYENLFEHAIEEYTKEWISNITENFENVDIEKEKKVAREEFISYYE
ncbi:MAG: hypothetical protein GTN68_29275 [Candidatus Aminicenantes bacterium]|nr:hypothetical protein [Candidatus Aminicenantes bacterium]NIO84660.1 hypothetical protein [Candidatus Aminicenantes bacterium]NIQ70601.1 hypothetical protein [Candidatus Aminicenantes bacterium]